MSMKAAHSLKAERDSLAALCERANRREGRITPPWQIPASQGLPGVPLNQIMEQFSDTGATRLLADIQAHPLYRRVVADVPRVETAPAESPFDPLRRVRAIADLMERPMSAPRRKSAGRPGRKRDAELNAIRRLQQVTTSPIRKRVLAEWTEELKRPSPVAWGRMAHPKLWLLAADLWIDAGTADVQLLLDAAKWLDRAGCDDSTAGRYIRQVRNTFQKRPAPAAPVASSPGLLGQVPLFQVRKAKKNSRSG
jgi:hypothetical protein